jgi:DNA-binding MarR family transcriptional regulator
MEIKISGTQIKMLRILKQKPQTSTQLAKENKNSYGYTLRIISVMQRNEIIAAKENPEDKRKKIWICTPRGIIELKKAEVKQGIMQQAMERMKKIDEILSNDLKKLGLLIEFK